MKLSNQLKADGVLFLITFCWGVSYYLTQVCLGELEPFTLNAFRFLLAFALIACVAGKRLLNVSKTTLKYSFYVGVAMVFVYIGSTFGVKYTSVSNSGFLCSLTVIFTPILDWIICKKTPDKKLSIAVLICVTGIALLTLGNDVSFNMEYMKGNALCVMCAFVYAIGLIITEDGVAKPDVDPFQLGVFQIGITGVLNLIVSFLIETPCLPQSGNIWAAAIFLAIFCTGLSYVGQPLAMQYTTASHVGVIFALEPVFSAIVAYLFANEVLTGKAYLGAALMMLSIFILEIDFKSIIKRREDDV